jgi:putative ATP-binding cassette transporter
MFYLPRGTPYLTRGSLREVLAYPLKADGFDDSAFTHALSRLGLERIVPMLDATRRWDRELSQDEQLCLAFARIVLQKPRWALIDDTLGSLDDEALERVIDVLGNELEGTTVINIGRAAQARDPLFTRVLHLVKAPAIRTLIHGRTAAAQRAAAINHQ